MNTDPLPPAARAELERLGVRWQQLPLARALPHVPALRALAQSLADEAADAAGASRAALPDLGPATAYDQLVVAAYDLAAASDHTGAPVDDPRGDRGDLAERLSALRLRLANA